MGNLKKKSKQAKKNYRKKKKASKGIKSLPFSKQTVAYARLEAYFFTGILIILVCLNKDVSAIAGALIGVAWASYRAVQMFYINLAKHEHLMDKKIEYKKLGLETSQIDEEIEVLETEEIDFNDFE